MCPVASDAAHQYDGFGESKLFKVNFTSLNKCGTIEFRQMGSSTDPSKIIHWILFIVRFCASAMNGEKSAEVIVARDEVEDVFEEIYSGQKTVS